MAMYIMYDIVPLISKVLLCRHYFIYTKRKFTYSCKFTEYLDFCKIECKTIPYYLKLKIVGDTIKVVIW